MHEEIETSVDIHKVNLWANRLRRLIKDAPRGIVVLVNHGTMSICDEEIKNEYEDRKGHRDNVPSLVDVMGSDIFEPNSESL